MIINLKKLQKKFKGLKGLNLKKHLSRAREETLCIVIVFFNQQKIRDSAGKALLKRNSVDIYSLICVARNCSNEFKEEAWERLSKEDLSEANLYHIIREIPYLRERAKKKLSEKYPEKNKKK